MRKANDTNEHFFKKLKNKFGLTKSDEEIFVPKKVAQRIIEEACLDPNSKKKSIKIKETVNPFTTSKNIFDLSDISDIDPVTDITHARRQEDEQSVSSRIFQLFNIAREVGMDCLNIDQITSAYYKVYTANKKDRMRDKYQIAAKIYNMDSYKVKNRQNGHLVKIANKASTYTVSNFNSLKG